MWLYDDDPKGRPVFSQTNHLRRKMVFFKSKWSYNSGIKFKKKKSNEERRIWNEYIKHIEGIEIIDHCRMMNGHK